MYSPLFACVCAFAIILQYEALLEERNGIPQLNIPQKWSIDANVYFYGKTFQGVVQNVIYKGASDFEVLENNINLKANLVTIKLLFPKVTSAMSAEINGSILNYQFDNKGITYTTTDDMLITYKLKGRRILKDNEEFLSFYNVHIDLQYKAYAVTGVTYLATKELNKNFTTEYAKNVDMFDYIFINIYLETMGVEIYNKLKGIYDTYPLNVLHPVE